jgi:hypothetical protein
MENTMKESAKTQQQLTKLMKDMSSALLNMSNQMVCSSLSQQSSSNPELAQQIHQLTTHSHVITQALDHQGLPLPKDEEPNAVLRRFQSIRLQVTPM